MLAYNKIILENLAIQATVTKAAELQLITEEKASEIKRQYPAALYTPNFFVRLGLGLLTFFIVIAALGLLALITNMKSFAFISFLMGIACCVMLEIITVQKKHFGSGVDNVLMMSFIVFITASIVEFLGYGPSYEVVSGFLVFIISLFLLLRFTDSIMAFVFSLAAQFWLFYFLTVNQILARQIVPFIMIICAGLLYVMAKRAVRSKWNVYYQLPLKIVSIIALVSIYSMGNYYVVREVSFEKRLPDLNKDVIVFTGWFFWLWTIVIPVIYFTKGFKKKNLTFIRLGIILFVLSVLTFRYYHAILPVETAMILAGAIIIIITYGLITYLHSPHFGFVFAKSVSKKTDVLNLEGLVIGEVFGNRNAPEQQQTKFGGGSFGGAGAGDIY